MQRLSDARQETAEMRRRGALASVAADFFVLIADEKSDIVLRLTVAEGVASGVGVGQVVDAGSGVEIVVIAKDAGFFSADKVELRGEKIRFVDAEVFGQSCFQAWRICFAPESKQFLLWINRVVATFHMGSEGWNDNLFRQADKMGLRHGPVIATAINAPGNSERAVEPGAEKRAAVDFNIEQAQLFAHKGRRWF